MESHGIPTDTFSSKPSTAGYSAQTLNSVHYGYLNKELINYDIPSSPRSLNDFSISYLPFTENELLLPELSLEDLDKTLSFDFASEPVDDNFAFTDSTLTNSQQLAQKLPLENSLVSFSQPSSGPVAMVGPLNDTQEQVFTKTVEFKAPESSSSGESGELLPPTPAVAHEQSEIRKAYMKAYQKAYVESEKGKACRKAYGESEKGKATNRAYVQSEKRKAYMKAYQKAYSKSEKRKAYRKAYGESEKGKAYRKAYNMAYNEVFNNTGDEEQARIAGKQATAFLRESYRTKSNEV